MKKGDERKVEILNTAERLFCTRGYAGTGIQDILDTLQISKGGFYHHFISKDAVLKTICERRAVAAAGRCAQVISTIENPLDRVNRILQSVFPLQKEDSAFFSMLLPTLDQSECAAVRMGYQEALFNAFHELLSTELRVASLAGSVYPVVQDAAAPCLLLCNHAWYEAALYILDCCRKEQRYEPAALLGILGQTRRCIEVLLDAPYGSIEPADLSGWDEIAQNLIRRMQPRA